MANDWHALANCKGVSLKVFFHPDGERGPERQQREDYAKRICGRCPVKVECLDEAFATPHDYGTWGALSERERRNIRQRRTVNVREYLRLREAGVQPAAAAALTAAPVETEIHHAS